MLAPFGFTLAKRSAISRAATITLSLLGSTALAMPVRASEFPPTVELSSLDGVTGFRLDGIEAGDQTGRSVASIGDINGDGFDEIIIGAIGAHDFVGDAYVVFGKTGGFGAAIPLSGLDGTNGFRLDGVKPQDYTGYDVAGAGDVNDDGLDDLIVAAPGADPHGEVSGSSYVLFGAGGFSSAINLATLDGKIGFRLDGGQAVQNNQSAAGASDVNGDGFADLIVGAETADPNGMDSGSSYVVFGKAGGFGPAINLSTVNGTNGFRLDGVAAFDRSGDPVRSAGDVNGDGFDDVIIGAYSADPSGDSSGSSYVVFGRANGFAPAMSLSSLDGANGFRLDGVAPGDRSGFSLEGAGDVNGDGFGDLIVGAWLADPKGTDSGSSYVVFGKAMGSDPIISLSTMNGANGFRLVGTAAHDHSGYSVAAAGDVNGDGFGDLIVGAPGLGDYTGASFVIFGKSGRFSSTVQLSTLDGESGFRMNGVASGDRSGSAVSSSGDVNGDGFSDVIVGAWQAPGGDGPGLSYVVFGRAPDAAVMRTGSAANQYISGGRYNDSLSGLGGNDVLEGRAGSDMLDGGPGEDTASYAHAVKRVTANLSAPGDNTGAAAGDRYISIENLAGSQFADNLTGTGRGNAIRGLGGDDTLNGRGGNDILIGGPGGDTLTGGGAADLFRYLALNDSPKGTVRDRITDFNAGSAGTFVDRIDLRPIDAKTDIAGDQAFAFIGTASFSNVSGQLRVQQAQAGTTAMISGDVNGDGVADFQIALLNFSNLAGLTGIDFAK